MPDEDFERVLQEAIDHQPVDVAPAHYYGQIGREYGQREAREDLEAARHDALIEHAKINSMARAVKAVAEEIKNYAPSASLGEWNKHDVEGTDIPRYINLYQLHRWSERLLKIARGEEK